MTGPTPTFWQARFETNQTGWDRGAPGPRLQHWLDSGELTPCRMAVPGCGSGWDVAELASRGFDVVGLDYTPAAVERARAHLQMVPHPNGQPLAARVVQADVLVWEPAEPLDAVYEQTCLCALHPDQWTAYAHQLWRWLRPGGELRALFMQRPRANALEEGRIEGPPYHCDINAMRALFPSLLWDWPAPPYAQVPHPNGGHELAVVLKRR
ncbi:MAG: hypothetical protein RI907_260 [Pseudomonadota bacterium]|jgi:SAM-dependent methyltransferase